MPVTGCTWQSSPNALGCWDRGEPPRPVRVGHFHPTAGSLPSPGAGCAFPWSRSCLPCLAASGACVGPGGRGWTSAPAHSLHQWLGMPRMPHTQVPRPGTSCACGDISVRPGASCAPGDGIAVPDGVECPRPGRHAPGHVECPRWWREPDGYGCSVWPGPDSGAQARVSRTPLRRCVLLMSEALTQVGAGGGVVVLETRVGRGKRSGGSQSRGPDRFRQGCGGGAGHSHPTAGSLQSRAGSPYPGAGPFPCLTPLLVPVQVPGSRGSTSSPAHFCFERAYCTRAGIYWSGVVRTARGPHLPGVPPTLLQ